MKNCGKENGYLEIDNVNATNSENVLHYNGHVQVLKDIDEPLKIHRQLERCDDNQQLDSCVVFKAGLTKDFCQHMNNMSYGNHFFSKFQPEMKCPIKKGTYDLSKAYVDVSEFLKLPVENKIWRQTVHVWTHSDKLVYCSEWSVKISAQSSRKSSKTGQSTASN